MYILTMLKDDFCAPSTFDLKSVMALQAKQINIG